MKRIGLLFINVCLATHAGAQISMNEERQNETQKRKPISELFKEMPDSLLPYLTKNNRLDMMDFMEAGMPAKVTNRLGGTSTMTALTPDSLSITMNQSMQIGLCLIERDSTIIEMTRTYKISESQEENVVNYYSVSWLPLPITPVVTSTLLKRDDEIFAKPQF